MQNRKSLSRRIFDLQHQARRRVSDALAKRAELARPRGDVTRSGGYNEAFVLSHWSSYQPRC